MLFLILTPENKEVFAKLLKYLDKKDWTFGSGKPIKDYRGTILDLYIFLYEDKTIRIGAVSSLDYVSKTVPIITVKDVPMIDMPFGYDKWMADFKASIEEALKKEIIYGTKTSL